MKNKKINRFESHDFEIGRKNNMPKVFKRLQAYKMTILWQFIFCLFETCKILLHMLI